MTTITVKENVSYITLPSRFTTEQEARATDQLSKVDDNSSINHVYDTIIVSDSNSERHQQIDKTRSPVKKRKLSDRHTGMDYQVTESDEDYI